MESERKIEVATLDLSHWRALEEVIGHQLRGNQKLVISVIDEVTSPAGDTRPTQTLDDWTGVYEGLSDTEVEKLDALAKTRADLTRELP